MIAKLDLPVLADSDIVVVGGGPSGFAAAVAAARRSGQVLLVEQTSMLGGLGTAGLVPMFAPTSDGERMVYGGIFEEVNLEMCRRMKMEPWVESWQPINVEILKRLLDETALSAGVRLLFSAKVCEVEIANGRIASILVATSSGLRRITGRRFIDATGDALVAALAGAEFEFGDENGVTMSPTLCAQFSNIDYDRVNRAREEGVTDRKIWEKMSEDGTAPLQERHFVCMKQISKRSASSNLGHIYGIDTLDEFELTRGYIEGRKIAHVMEEFYRNNVPGYEEFEMISTASLLGVRETRRIRGEYRMVYEDFARRAVFEDEIGRCCYGVDIHANSTDPAAQSKVEEVLHATRFGKGESYGISYRALIPVGIRNLLVPGRALSADRAIQSSLRVMPPCFVTGQAAGVAATLTREEVREVEIPRLRSALAELGAYFK